MYDYSFTGGSVQIGDWGISVNPTNPYAVGGNVGGYYPVPGGGYIGGNVGVISQQQQQQQLLMLGLIVLAVVLLTK